MENAKRKPRTRGNGTGTVFKRGSSYCVQVTLGWDETGKRIYRSKCGFRTKKEAMDYIPILRNDSPKNRKVSLLTYYKTWSENGMLKLSPSKQTAYRIAFDKLQDLRYIDMRSLTVATLQEQINKTAPTFYPARDIKSVLSHLYHLALADEVVSNDLSKLIDLPKLEEKSPEPFTECEIAKLWKTYESGNIFVGYILLMIYSGMMPGELLACRKEHIHLDTREIIGCGAKTDIRKKTPIIIADFVVPVVEQLIEASSGAKLVTMNKDNFYTAYHDALSSADVRDLPPYSCRHTTATALAVGAQVAPFIVQRVMRHAKITTTQRYVHADTDSLHTAIDSLK